MTPSRHTPLSSATNANQQPVKKKGKEKLTGEYKALRVVAANQADVGHSIIRISIWVDLPHGLLRPIELFVKLV
jgi:hypothetical protein